MKLPPCAGLAAVTPPCRPATLHGASQGSTHRSPRSSEQRHDLNNFFFAAPGVLSPATCTWCGPARWRQGMHPSPWHTLLYAMSEPPSQAAEVVRLQRSSTSPIMLLSSQPLVCPHIHACPHFMNIIIPPHPCLLTILFFQEALGGGCALVLDAPVTFSWLGLPWLLPQVSHR